MNKSETKTRAPELIAYHIETRGEGENQKSYWTRVGVAWAHKDLEGFNIELTCIPVDGKVVLRKPKEDKAGSETPTKGEVAQ